MPADVLPFSHPIPKTEQPVTTSPIDGGPIALPVILGCAGRCGKTAAVHWPHEPSLADLVHELRAQRWVLATAEIAGLGSIVGVVQHATAPLCADCATGTRARAKLNTGRVPTLQR